MELVDRPQDDVVDEVVGLGALTHQRDRVPAEPRNFRDNRLALGFCAHD